jgi:glycosyltransferase involved in cell wall biosynthesis
VTTQRPRALVAHPDFSAVGGDNVVVAWTLQALRDEFDVTFATFAKPDLQAINSAFGTSLRPGDFRLCVAPVWRRQLLRRLPIRGAMLTSSLAANWAREVDRRHPHDVAIYTQNEANLGRTGAIQYIHFPGWYLPRPDIEMRWFHRIPGFLPLYRWICFRAGQLTPAVVRGNISLANSRFVAGKIRDVHGVESRILYPPVPGEFPARTWLSRSNAAVCVGRIHPAKRWHMAIDIVEELRRATGQDVGLTLIGHVDTPAYAAELQSRAAQSGGWFRILPNLTRSQLRDEVARHRYGIHTMEEEHFGIAPAEIQQAGCILFVHASGGPMEIVGNDPRQMFRTSREGAQKMAAVLTSEALQSELLAAGESRKDMYSPQRFCESLLDIVKSEQNRQLRRS